MGHALSPRGHPSSSAPACLVCARVSGRGPGVHLLGCHPIRHLHTAWSWCLSGCVSYVVVWPMQTYVPARSGPFACIGQRFCCGCLKWWHSAPFCAALIGGGAVGAKAEIIASVPAGVHWRASPEGMPLWGPNRFWPGSGLVLRCLGPGFSVLALGPGFRPAVYDSIMIYVL